MPEAADRTTRVTALVDAPIRKVYRAFLDPDAVSLWLAPEGMSVRMHEFDPREGGGFRISLTYDRPDPASPGKTDAATDTYHGRFVALVPDECVVQAIEFESTDPALAGEMRMTSTLAPARQGTYVTIVCEDIPPGISLEDNTAGTASSLEKLAVLVGRQYC